MRAVMMRTRMWLLVSGTLGAQLFHLASETGSRSWWEDIGSTASAVMLLTAVRHPRLSDERPADQQVVVHGVEPADRARVLALLGKTFQALVDGLPTDVTSEPWPVVSRLTQRRAGQVVAYLADYGVRAEGLPDPRVRAHRGVLRAAPLVVGLGLLLANGTLVHPSMLPPVLHDVALVAAWLLTVGSTYVVADLVLAGRPPRPSDWEPVVEVTGPYDVELVSLPGHQRIHLIHALRAVLDTEFHEAERLVEADLPAVVDAGLSRAEAKRLATAITAFGGSAVVVRRDEHQPEES